MNQIIINQLAEENGSEIGITVIDLDVMTNLKTILKPEVFEKLSPALELRPKEPMYFFKRFCQFVIYFQYDQTLGLSMKTYDFNGSVDAGLDEYSLLKENNWAQKDIDLIMKLFVETQSQTDGQAEMVLNPIFL